MTQKSFESMPGILSQRLRNIVQMIDAADIERMEAFKERNKAKKQLEELGDEPSAERDKTLKTYAEHLLRIARLDGDIKYLVDELKRTIRKEGEPGLFESPDVEIPRHVHAPAPSEPEGAQAPEPDTGKAESRPGELALVFPGKFVFVSHQPGIEGCTVDIEDRPRLDAKVRALCGTANLTFDPPTGLVYDGGRHLLTVMNAAEPPKRTRKARR